MKNNIPKPTKSLKLESTQKTLDIVVFLYFDYKYKWKHKEKLIKFFLNNNSWKTEKEIIKKIEEFENTFDKLVLSNLK